LSPSLFSVMLSEHNVGVPIASQIINGLLYADDVTLMTESDLQTMLNITYGVVFVHFHWLNQSRDIQNISSSVNIILTGPYITY